MSVLILSPDENAKRSLSSALQRRGVAHSQSWTNDELPLVAVLDVADEHYEATLRAIRRSAPWSRCYLIAERGTPHNDLAPTIHKPFDASALAAMLEREGQLAAERRVFEQKFEHNERLAHLGRMAATLSHEINNPLAVIRSNAAWLSQTALQLENAELAEVAVDLELASERIATFMDQMTGFARRGTAELQNSPLTQSLTLALRMVRPRAEAQAVSLTHETDDASRHATPHDSTRFAHAVINVLSNAIDAAATGGHHVWLRVIHEPTWTIVEVDDDGPGVAPEARERIFEAFYTTKPFGRGTGLGLWLTQRIIEEHHGEIQLESSPRGGARVRLKLRRGQE